MIVSTSLRRRFNSSRSASRLRRSSSRSTISVAGTAISREQAAQTSASSSVSDRQYGQFILASWRNPQRKADAAGSAVAVLDVDPHQIFARGQFGLRHIDAVGLDERLVARRHGDLRGAQIKSTFPDSISILAPPKLSNLSCSRSGECAASFGEITSTFGPRRMPRVLAEIAPFGGGSLASSSVINGVALATPRLRRLPAKMPSHIHFVICPLTLYFQP